MHYNIGKVLHALRKKKGISQDQLAKETGLSKGLISQIENDKASLSLSNLQRISSALHIELSRFFYHCETDSAQNCTVVPRDQQNCIEEHGIKIRELIQGLEETALHPIVFEIEAGHQTRVHRHEGDELIYLVSGKLNITVGKESHTLNSGDYAIVKGLLQHKLENITPSRIQVFSVNIKD